jgi:predicted TIM-barrel fold metal-dependent hydrolase
MNSTDSDHAGLYRELRQALGEMQVVDAHEHLPSEEQWIAQASDLQSPLLSALGYAVDDLVCAGMPEVALSTEMSLTEAWEQIRPFWPFVRNMGPGSLCRRALTLFCGVDDLTDATLPIIQEKLAGLRKPGIYRRLFEDYHITVCLNTLPSTVAPLSEFFAPLVFTTPLALVQKRSDIHSLEQAADQPIYSLRTYLQALDTLLERRARSGFVGLKWHTLAYLRDIHYPLADAHSAEVCLDRILRMPAQGGAASDTPVGFDEMRPFQNLIQHHLIRRAIDLDWPVQIHTGIFGGSRGAQITHAKPTHLVDLFLRYPQARFDLLHASYPYTGELTALAKLFSNVYINTAWFELLSPGFARQYLREWIRSVPLNKIFAFGADQFSPLLSCAYAETVRDNLSEALAAEVADGTMSQQQALHAAARLLRENAWEYFRLEERWANRQESTAETQIARSPW